MASTSSVPRRNNEDVASSSSLVSALIRVRDSGKKSNVRSTDHNVALSLGKNDTNGSAVVQEAADDDDEKQHSFSTNSVENVGQTVTLTSWKTQEFAYRKTTKVGLGEDDELPTLARGLFTMAIGTDQHRIVVRGYDKFFNEDEMPWTKKEAIAKYSSPPYELSFKENGCIIFIAALSPHQLIVTSKHSLGSNESHEVSHAQKGEQWLDKHLARRGKRKSDLALELWNRSETAVAELCDDQFEEHVLAYPAERTGLHLHGLNKNSAEFMTRPMQEVEQFAQEWGFLPTRYLTIDNLADVEKFCQSVGESGSWQGIPIEGFVVRTHKPMTDSSSKDGKDPVSPPYKTGQAWFYKVKFDEPYLMYRDWRELTRRMLSDKQKSTRPETRLFVEWCYEKLYGSKDGRQKPELNLFESFSQNKGIINLREKFIEYMNSSEGKARLAATSKKSKASNGSQAQSDAVPLNGEQNNKTFDKTLIVPIAVPGCGKTVLAVALSHLIPDFGHTQSDNVQSKKTAPTFLRNIGQELNNHDVVFADRNNHLFKHRNEIVDMIKTWQQRTDKGANRVRLIAVAWSLNTLPLNAIHHICSDRIAQRGENHQTLRSTENKDYEQILWQFLRNLETFGSGEKGGGDKGHGDSAFDKHIRLSPNASMEQNLLKLIQELMPLLGLPIPDDKKVKVALQKALEYKVSLKKEVKGAPLPRIRYYGLAIESNIIDFLPDVLAPYPTALEAFEALKESNRIIQTPHVTLVHSSEVEGGSVSAKKRWETFSQLANNPNPPLFSMFIDLIAWDDRAMALGVSEVRSEGVPDLYTLQGQQWRPHVTIGTFAESIRPFEANRVLSEADAGQNEDNVHCVRFQSSIRMQSRIKGMS
ncbi:uncharacterized protein FA14DRAFT_144791 [Meira miltonrushii]|uniref:tRNA ligase n=1 Tax=Meira miltonrushii TaxID=1280837 RepID=A0A316VGL6_9BASI|nr:uncharacterized protein FA14DRAFT_144791 [Meira miltonrushii]PWN35141.1 hypothetical protein FA14DRAFT_144791 [Meira miltonrushii]